MTGLVKNRINLKSVLAAFAETAYHRSSHAYGEYK